MKQAARKCLLVDDEPGCCDISRTLLELDEYEVETASTGEETIELLQKRFGAGFGSLDLLMRGSTVCRRWNKCANCGLA